MSLVISSRRPANAFQSEVNAHDVSLPSSRLVPLISTTTSWLKMKITIHEGVLNVEEEEEELDRAALVVVFLFLCFLLMWFWWTGIRRVPPGEPAEELQGFACDQCGLWFARRDVMVAHRRTHTGERPYACEECGRLFSRRWTMMNHVRTHTGERPYRCPTCGETFRRRETLTRHQNRH